MKIDNGRFGLTCNDKSKYKFLKHLTPEEFTSMMEILLRFQLKACPDRTTSILNYHVGRWKQIRAFHLKIHPKSPEDFYSTIEFYINEQDPSKRSSHQSTEEYERSERKMRFIAKEKETTDAFHVLNDKSGDQVFKFYISRRTHSIVAVNSIDMIKCEHPYCEAYRYARMLETCFLDAMGGVSFGIDHSGKTVWVWADFDEEQFEEKVLTPREVTKTGKFEQYKSLKPVDCKAVIVKKINPSIGKSDLSEFFENCGEIDHIDVPMDRRGHNYEYAFVHFKDTKAVDEAMKLGGRKIDGRNVVVNYHLYE